MARHWTTLAYTHGYFRLYDDGVISLVVFLKKQDNDQKIAHQKF